MIKELRRDSWQNDQDNLLIKTVLHHIRIGSTQLKAFDEVSEALGRSSAACGFRWNKELRNQLVSEIQAAKKARLALRSEEIPKSEKSSIEDYQFNKEQIKKIIQIMSEYETIVERMKQKISKKETIIAELKKEIEELKRNPSDVVQSDEFSKFLNILSRARNKGILSDEDKFADKLIME